MWKYGRIILPQLVTGKKNNITVWHTTVVTKTYPAQHEYWIGHLDHKIIYANDI